jgi:hypothetical protein
LVFPHFHGGSGESKMLDLTSSKFKRKKYFEETPEMRKPATKTRNMMLFKSFFQQLSFSAASSNR